MNPFFLCFSILSNAAGISVINEPLVQLAVYSVEKSVGSISLSGYAAYTKEFDVTVINLSENNINMSKFCLKAASSEKLEYTLDSVSDSLKNGVILPGMKLNGTATFLSKSEDIHKASSIVTLASECGENM